MFCHLLLDFSLLDKLNNNNDNFTQQLASNLIDVKMQPVKLKWLIRLVKWICNEANIFLNLRFMKGKACFLFGWYTHPPFCYFSALHAYIRTLIERTCLELYKASGQLEWNPSWKQLSSVSQKISLLWRCIIDIISFSKCTCWNLLLRNR